jgi:DNA-binding transcriptional regulator YiaG
MLDQFTTAQTPMLLARQSARILAGFRGATTATGMSDDVPIALGGTQAEPEYRLVTPQRSSPARDVLEIRFISGLTWGELAELFSVSRRAVHNWANGDAMKPDNILLVRNMLTYMQLLRRASSAETRLALLAERPSGERPIDLLKAGRWADAIAAVQGVPRINLPASPHPDPQQGHPVAYLEARIDTPGSTSGPAVPGASRRMPHRSR